MRSPVECANLFKGQAKSKRRREPALSEAE
jgi:hypothetical protein